MRVPIKALAAAVAGFAASSVVADTVFPLAKTPGFNHWKTPPLANSQAFQVPLFYHSTFAYTNWGGVIVDINIDTNPREANFFGANGSVGFFETFGTASVPIVTFWATSAYHSGTTNHASQTVQLGNLDFHASHTNPINNSDTDITFSAWNIFHVTQTAASGNGNVPASNLLYVRPGQAVSTWGQGVAPRPGEGVWVHNPSPHPVHLAASWFFATGTFVTGAWGVGVEHVPEPAAAAMLIGGAGIMLVARRRRRA
jgi:hypothetical protein